MTAPSQLRVLGRVALRRLRRQGTTPLPLAAPRRRTSIERDGLRPELARLRRYLRATGGERIGGGSSDARVLPPLFPAVWEAPLAAELLADAGVPLLGLVHLEGETLRPRPLRLGDRVRCRVELERAEPHPRGLRFQLLARSWNATGQLCAESILVLLAPDNESPGKRSTPRPAPRGAGEWRELVAWNLGAGRGRRYALASGDWNPIHLWGWTARPFGFRRPILHGFCTEALVAHALVEHRWGGDPAALCRLRIRFRAPLVLPCRAALQLLDETDAGPFRVTGPRGELFAEGEFAGG